MKPILLLNVSKIVPKTPRKFLCFRDSAIFKQYFHYVFTCICDQLTRLTNQSAPRGVKLQTAADSIVVLLTAAKFRFHNWLPSGIYSFLKLQISHFTL